jgi:hypothetical protein
MSETRPPITAGPIERAFRFLKSTSVSCAALGEGAGVSEEESGGFVLAGDAAGDAPLIGKRPGGVSSCADKIEAAKIESSETPKTGSCEVMGSRV